MFTLWLSCPFSAPFQLSVVCLFVCRVGLFGRLAVPVGGMDRVCEMVCLGCLKIQGVGVTPAWALGLCLVDPHRLAFDALRPAFFAHTVSHPCFWVGVCVCVCVLFSFCPVFFRSVSVFFRFVLFSFALFCRSN